MNIGLGQGLLIGGATLAAVAILWLLVNLIGGTLTAGGFVLGLFILGLFVVPIIAFGLTLRSRAARESVEEATFDVRRRALDQDRLFRETLRARLDEVTRVLDATAATSPLVGVRDRLRALASDVGRGPDEAAWLMSTTLSADDVRDLAQYDDLLTHEARELTGTAQRARDAASDEAIRALDGALRSLERHWGSRQDFFLRGRRPPPTSPLALARGRGALAPGGDIASLRTGDAVSLGDDDLTVVAVLTYFGDGRTTRALTLRTGSSERRLIALLDGDQFMLDPISPPPRPAAPPESQTTSVTVDASSGSTSGVIVRVESWRGPDNALLRYELWPDGELWLRGERLLPGEAQFWPRGT